MLEADQLDEEVVGAEETEEEEGAGREERAFKSGGDQLARGGREEWYSEGTVMSTVPTQSSGRFEMSSRSSRPYASTCVGE